MKLNISKFSFIAAKFFICSLIAIGSNPPSGFAADKQATKTNIQFIHRPLTEKALPAPGQSLTIALELAGTREISLPVSIVAVRDGRMLPVPLSNAYRDANDKPIYEFELASPLAELTYQFLIPGSAVGSSGVPALVSDKFTVRRPCIPAFNSSTAGNANHSELDKLAVEARVLEQEIDAYTSALTASEMLQKEVGQ